MNFEVELQNRLANLQAQKELILSIAAEGGGDQGFFGELLEGYFDEVHWLERNTEQAFENVTSEDLIDTLLHETQSGNKIEKAYYDKFKKKKIDFKKMVEYSVKHLSRAPNPTPHVRFEDEEAQPSRATGNFGQPSQQEPVHPSAYPLPPSNVGGGEEEDMEEIIRQIAENEERERREEEERREREERQERQERERQDRERMEREQREERDRKERERERREAEEERQRVEREEFEMFQGAEQGGFIQEPVSKIQGGQQFNNFHEDMDNLSPNFNDPYRDEPKNVVLKPEPDISHIKMPKRQNIEGQSADHSDMSLFRQLNNVSDKSKFNPIKDLSEKDDKFYSKHSPFRDSSQSHSKPPRSGQYQSGFAQTHSFFDSGHNPEAVSEQKIDERLSKLTSTNEDVKKRLFDLENYENALLAKIRVSKGQNLKKELDKKKASIINADLKTQVISLKEDLNEAQINFHDSELKFKQKNDEDLKKEQNAIKTLKQEKDKQMGVSKELDAELKAINDKIEKVESYKRKDYDYGNNSVNQSQKDASFLGNQMSHLSQKYSSGYDPDRFYSSKKLSKTDVKLEEMRQKQDQDRTMYDEGDASQIFGTSFREPHNSGYRTGELYSGFNGSKKFSSRFLQ